MKDATSTAAIQAAPAVNAWHAANAGASVVHGLRHGLLDGPGAGGPPLLDEVRGATMRWRGSSGSFIDLNTLTWVRVGGHWHELHRVA